MLIDFLPTIGRALLPFCFLLVFATPMRAGEVIIGPVDRVVDGDTLYVRNVKIRLDGVDAPEMSENLGRKSRQAMIDIVLGQTVECHLDGASYDRQVGICYLTSTGADIGAVLIRQGLALDCPRHSGGRYADEEDAAVAAGAVPLLGKAYCQR